MVVDDIIATIVAVGIAKLYSKFFGTSGTPDSVALNFDPDDRKPKRIYGMAPAETNAEIINKFQKPIWEGYGITQGDVHTHLWDPIFQHFVSHGGGWHIDVNAWAGLVADFLAWTGSQGKSQDPRPLLSAHDSFGVQLQSSWGSGRLKRKNLIPLSAAGQDLYNLIVQAQGGGTIPTNGGTGGTNQAGLGLSGILDVFKNPIVLGATAFVLLLMLGGGKSQMPQYIVMEGGKK